MTRLIIREEFFVDESSIRVDLVQLSKLVVSGLERRQLRMTNRFTILSPPSFPETFLPLPLPAARRISAPSAVSAWSTRPTLYPIKFQSVRKARARASTLTFGQEFPGLSVNHEVKRRKPEHTQPKN